MADSGSLPEFDDLSVETRTVNVRKCVNGRWFTVKETVTGPVSAAVCTATTGAAAATTKKPTARRNIATAATSTSAPKPPRVAKKAPRATVLTEFDDVTHEHVTVLTPPPASAEQLEIVSAIADNNVIVDAVAGSGKTTTVMHVALGHPQARILMLTYNASLRLETRERAAKYGIDNMQVYTYHAYCVREMDRACWQDSAIIEHLPHYKRRRHGQPCQYDIIIVDECQDMMPLYFDIVGAIIGGGDPRLLICGDYKQAIYGYRGADPRFLTMAPELYPSTSSRPWKRLTLSVSYRITSPMAAFVNAINCGAAGDDTRSRRITAIKDGVKPRYVHCNYATLAKIIKDEADRSGPENIFVLAPSVRIVPTHRLAPLANALTALKIPIYVPTSDDRCPDDKVLDGKVAFVTYHQSKGLERDIVFVLSFDCSQFTSVATIPADLPNTLYVAVTRARVRLYVHQIEYHVDYFPKSAALPFVTPAIIRDHCELVGVEPTHGQYNRVQHVYPTAVTDLIRHIPDVYSTYMMSMVIRRQVRAAGDRIEVPPVAAQPCPYPRAGAGAGAAGRKGQIRWEEVSELTGHASVAHYELSTTNDAEIVRATRRHTQCGDRGTVRLRALAKRVVNGADPYTPTGLLRYATAYNGIRSELAFKMVQIKYFNWVTDEQFNEMTARLSDVLGPACHDHDGVPMRDFERAVTAPGFDDRVFYLYEPGAPAAETMPAPEPADDEYLDSEDVVAITNEVRRVAGRETGVHGYMDIVDTRVPDTLVNTPVVTPAPIPAPTDVLGRELDEMRSMLDDIIASLETKIELVDVPAGAHLDTPVSERVQRRLFEIKTTSMLTHEHMLQLLVYYYGLRCIGEHAVMHLYNVLTDELVVLEVSDANLCTIMRVINHVKFHNDDALSDEEFIARSRAWQSPADLIARCPRCRDKFTSL